MPKQETRRIENKNWGQIKRMILQAIMLAEPPDDTAVASTGYDWDLMDSDNMPAVSESHTRAISHDSRFEVTVTIKKRHVVPKVIGPRDSE